MKGLPFCSEMMLAWLARRKTVTRRLINPQPAEPCSHSYQHPWEKWWTFGDNSGRVWKPRYLSGETVYIKETWAEVGSFDPGLLVYRADYPKCVPPQFENVPEAKDIKWKPGMFMPEKFSRSKAFIVSVRPERVQEISAEDAIAEGLTKISKDNGRLWKYGIPDRDGLPGADNLGWPWENWRISPIDAYESLWDSINAKKYPWSSNPWVWRYELNKI